MRLFSFSHARGGARLGILELQGLMRLRDFGDPWLALPEVRMVGR